MQVAVDAVILRFKAGAPAIPFHFADTHVRENKKEKYRDHELKGSNGIDRRGR